MSDTPYRLVIQSGTSTGRSFALEAASITIGRYPLADIVIDDPDLAYRHALLTRADTSFRIADLGSDSGTYVNGQRVGAEPVALNHGDIIMLGSRLSVAYLEHDIELPNENEIAGNLDNTPGDVIITTSAPRDQITEGLITTENEYDPPDLQIQQPAESAIVESPHAAPVVVAAHKAHHPEPLPAIPPPQKNRNGRIAMIAAGCLIALLACCCSSTLFMYFIGGDLLLRLLGYVP